MTYCVKCGAQIDERASFCPQCGAPVPKEQARDPYGYESDPYGQNYSYNYGQNDAYGQNGNYGQYDSYGGDAGWFAQEEVQQNKVMAVLSYIGVLVLIPLLAGDKTSAYLKQHVNQGLALFIISAVLEFVERIFDDVIPLGWVISWPLGIAQFALFIILIMGIVSACKGTRKPLPIVGNIHILK